MKKGKTLKKTIAIMVSLCLVFTMAVPSFAVVGGDDIKKPESTHSYSGTGETLNVVALGDSQTNGYFMEGFFKKNNNNDFIMDPNDEDSVLGSSGFNIYIEGTYPELLADHIAETTGNPVDFYQYAMSALRYEDLHKLLDPEFEADDFYKCWLSDKTVDQQKFSDPSNYFGKSYYDSGYKAVGTYDTLHNNYTWAVENADVLTLALGVNNFGNYLSSRFLAAISGDEDGDYLKMDMDSTKYLNLTESKKEFFDKCYEKVYNLILSMVGEDNEETLEKVDSLTKDMLYSVSGFVEGYKYCLDDIYELNPDVNLIVVGMSNVTEGLVVTFEEQGVPIKVDLGKIIGVILDVGNLYLASEGAKSKLDTTYVSPGSFGKFIENIAKLDTNNAAFNNNMELLVQYSVEYFVENYGKGVFGDDIVNKMLKVKDADKDKPAEEQEYVLNMKDIKESVNRIQTNGNVTDADCIGKVYLGLRDAIIYAAKNTSKIDLIDAIPVFTKSENAITQLKNTFDNQERGTDLRTKVFNTFSQKGVSDYMYICARILVHSAGSHINEAGHAAVAERVIAAYDKHEKTKEAKQLLKKATPVIVGGVAVTMIASSVVKNIKNKSDKSIFDCKKLFSSDTSDEKSGLAKMISNAVAKVKEMFSKIFGRTDLEGALS